MQQPVSLEPLGSPMDGAGLKESITTVYEGSVESMLNGKTISRAVRSHTLVENVLLIIKDTWFTCSTDVPPTDVSSGL